MKYVMVIPYAYKPYYDKCIATLKIPPENILALDNTIFNLGVAGSWNIGIDTMRSRNADWLIICSATMRFGDDGGLDMISHIEQHPQADLINFASIDTEPSQFVRGKSPGIEAGMFSWYLCAINRNTIDSVGKFDGNFYPCYFEDIDYDMRVNKYFNNSVDWAILPINATFESRSHAVELGGVKSDPTPLIAYFATKWGRHPSAAELGDYATPFNDKNNSLAFWPPANGGIYDD